MRRSAAESFYRIVITTFIVIALLTSAWADNNVYAASGSNQKKVSDISYTIKSGISSLTVKWKNKTGVRKWVIYRGDVTKYVDSGFEKKVPLSKYKKIATLKGSKITYKDKKVKRHHYYAYIIRGYKRVKGKYVKAYDSYLDGVTDFSCPGLAKPELLNGGNGEFYSNSGSKIYLYVQQITGMKPDGAVFYRKGPGESKYKRVKLKAVEKMGFSGVFLDKNVKPGKTYRYYVKVWRKSGKKKYYSRASAKIKVTAKAPSPEEDDL